jgi:iron complex transport system substrate-binding protein
LEILVSGYKRVSIILIFLLLFCPAGLCKDIRVVSLAPSITEILFGLGLTEKEIIGITDYCNFPEQTRRIPKIGSLTTINIEKVVSLKPDYVFSAGSAYNSLNASLKSAGLDVKTFNVEDLNGLFLSILDIGRTLGRQSRAEEFVKGMRQRFERIRAKAAAIKEPKRVYVEIWGDPITSGGKGSLVDEVITEAGGINIAGAINTLYPTPSPEFIISRNPDVIILGYMSRDQKGLKKMICERPGWQNIKAVRSENIICDINPDIFLRPGPRILDGIEQIQKRLYGE